ncbi:MAG: chromate transporter [Bacteroidales bacterium]|nr:chromate transporter [Bacteroidales bacterium]MDD5815195.1 chromate transporter [Bacteroidales bacterium]
MSKFSGLSDTLSLFGAFFKIGFFTFGGGLAMIPFIEDEFVAHRRWISKDEMNEMVVLSQTLPGVVAINVSIFVGHKRAGLVGAICAALGTALPALLAIVLILALLQGFEDNVYVKMVFVGIKAASAALILDTVIRLAQRNLRGTAYWIVAALGLLVVLLGFSAAWSVVLGAIVGLAFFHSSKVK